MQWTMLSQYVILLMRLANDVFYYMKYIFLFLLFRENTHSNSISENTFKWYLC